VDDVAVVEKCLIDFRAELTEDLVGLHEAYECNIQSLGGICVRSSIATPSVEDYVRWLTSEVGYLPEVFTSVNENFVSAAIEGVLLMAKETNFVDLDALQISVPRVVWMFSRGREMSKGPPKLLREAGGIPSAISLLSMPFRQRFTK
jgi:hypothetical protein